MLEWIGKPVIVLLNQTGPPRPRDEDALAETRWRDALQRWPHVRAVLTLDAFARCWIQEFALFEAVDPLLPSTQRPAFARLMAAWHARRMAQFDEAMRVLAAPIARAAEDREALPPSSVRDKVVRAVGLARQSERSPEAIAMGRLAERLEAGLQTAMQELIAIHGLTGTAAAEALARVASAVRTDAPVDEGKAALMGGVVSGALTGLAADLASGGLTFGGGMVAGALLGAFGGAGIARGFNTIRGRNEALLRWDNAFLDEQVASALLRYLAIAHYGRGRGDWRAQEYPDFWRALVASTIAAQHAALFGIWELRDTEGAADVIAARLQVVLEATARSSLDELYPDTTRHWDSP